MSQKRDWGKILTGVLQVPLVQDLIKKGLLSLSEISRGGLPFRKKVKEDMAVMRAEIEALKVAVKELIADKIEAEEAKSKSVKAVKKSNEEASNGGS